MNSDENRPLVLYSTFSSMEEAEKIGRVLLEEKLAGCINIIPQTIAIYEWEGEIQRDSECAMLIKSRNGLKKNIIVRVNQLHSYDTPALLALNIDGGSNEFISWLTTQTN